MQHLAENRDSGVVSLGWYVCVYVCVCHAKLEIFPRFSSRAPGKCLITSGFVLSAMIILFYAVLFSYSGLRMKALIFHWSTHWGTFCVYIWIHSFLFNLLVPIGARFNICATAFSVQVSETGGGALVFNLRAETEQTPRLIDSKWRFCWNRFSVGLTAGSQWPFLSPQTEHRIKGVIYREEVAAGDGTPRCWKQSSTSVFPITWSFFWNNRVSWWWFRGHRSDTDSSHHLSLFVCFFLQRGSATWQWTPTPWQCPCQTPTPGQRPWTTWGCLPLEWLVSSSCQVSHCQPESNQPMTTDAFLFKKKKQNKKTLKPVTGEVIHIDHLLSKLGSGWQKSPVQTQLQAKFTPSCQLLSLMAVASPPWQWWWHLFKYIYSSNGPENRSEELVLSLSILYPRQSQSSTFRK